VPDAPASVLLPPTPGARTFHARRPVRLADVDVTGRLRFDGIARFLQDVATDDAADARLDRGLGWVVRRTMIEVGRSARLDEEVELTTFCTGTGRSWAERRTSILGALGAEVDAVSLWVQIDARSGRPSPLGADFTAAYGPAAAGRRVSARLGLPGPPADGVDRVSRRPWAVRRSDLDPYAHMNNAAYWAAFEEVLPAGSRRGCAELEHVAPIDAGEAVDLVSVDGPGGVVAAWLTGVDGAVRAAARWTPAAGDVVARS
jgi:acyl-ACP thioesterase